MDTGKLQQYHEKHACLLGMTPTGLQVLLPIGKLPTLLATSFSPLALAVVLSFTSCIAPCPRVATASSGALAGKRVLLAVAELLIFKSDRSLAAVLTEFCR